MITASSGLQEFQISIKRIADLDLGRARNEEFKLQRIEVLTDKLYEYGRIIQRSEGSAEARLAIGSLKIFFKQNGNHLAEECCNLVEITLEDNVKSYKNNVDQLKHEDITYQNTATLLSAINALLAIAFSSNDNQNIKIVMCVGGMISFMPVSVVLHNISYKLEKMKEIEKNTGIKEQYPFSLMIQDKRHKYALRKLRQHLSNFPSNFRLFSFIGLVASLIFHMVTLRVASDNLRPILRDRPLVTMLPGSFLIMWTIFLGLILFNRKEENV